jgi:phosphoglycerate dehydrogenase-like enzyme
MYGKKLLKAMRKLHTAGWFGATGDASAEEDARIAAEALMNTALLRTNQTRNKKAVAEEVASLLTFSVRGGAFLRGVIEEENGHSQAAREAGHSGTTYYVRLTAHGRLDEDFGRVFATGSRSGRTWKDWL